MEKMGQKVIQCNSDIISVSERIVCVSVSPFSSKLIRAGSPDTWLNTRLFAIKTKIALRFLYIHVNDENDLLQDPPKYNEKIQQLSSWTKWHVRPAKTQISLGIRPVWSESSLSAWRKLGSFATHWAHSEDSDQTGRMPRLIWVFAGRTVILLVLSWGGSA